MNEGGLNINDTDIIKDIKEKKCFIANDYESEIKHHSEPKN